MAAAAPQAVALAAAGAAGAPAGVGPAAAMAAGAPRAAEQARAGDEDEMENTHVRKPKKVLCRATLDVVLK